MKVQGREYWVVVTSKVEAAGVDGLASWVVVTRSEWTGEGSLVSNVGRAGAAGSVKAEGEVDVDEEGILRDAWGG